MNEKDCADQEGSAKDLRSSGSTEGGISAGRDVRAGRDIAGRDIIHGVESAQGNELRTWQAQIEERIQASDLSPALKQDVKEQVEKIRTEAEQGQKADKGRLERLINTIAVMAPDIFDVVVTTLANPLAGIGLVLKKIGDKARIESQAEDQKGLPG